MKNLKYHSLIKNPLLIFFYFITLIAILSYYIPNAQAITGYQYVTAIPRGIYKSISLIFLVLVLGGTYSVLEHSGLINAGIGVIWQKYKDNPLVFIYVIIFLISIIASFFGILSELILLIPLFMNIINKMRLPSILGVAIVLLSAKIGFAAGITNPFTVQIPQSLANLPVYNAIIFRCFCYIVTLSFVYIFMFLYLKNKLNNSQVLANNIIKFEEFSYRHRYIILSSVSIFVLSLIVINKLNLSNQYMILVYLFIGASAAFISKFTLLQSINYFMLGIRRMVFGALLIGFARSIEIILHDSNIINLILNYAISYLKLIPVNLNIIGMLFLQIILDILMPSATAQAVVSIPILMPIANEINIHPQLIPLAFQFGDGFTNLITPTSGVLLAFLSYGHVSYYQWVKFIWKLYIFFILLSCCFLFIANMGQGYLL